MGEDAEGKVWRQGVSVRCSCGRLMRRTSAASATTLQRPLNNLVRTVVGGMASAMSGGAPEVWPPYDEPLGLGWSLEAIQLTEDAQRILQHEAKICEVIDPFAGSYFMESLTDQIEEAGWAEFEKIQSMGGVVAAIESGYMQQKVAKECLRASEEDRERRRLGGGCQLLYRGA